MTLTLPISEVFGPTLQGEGPYAGRTVQFVRLGGCNLACTWCDSAYTWNAARFDLRTEIVSTPVDDVLAQLVPGVPVVLSGGEPLLHQNSPAFNAFVDGLVYRGHHLYVETNGTLRPSTQLVSAATHFAVSPKLSHAGDHKPTQDPTPWNGWHTIPQAVFKYVVQDEVDVATVVSITDALQMPRSRVWVMPLGTTNEELLDHWPAIATAAATQHVNATQRLHVLAWGDTKGT